MKYLNDVGFFKVVAKKTCLKEQGTKLQRYWVPVNPTWNPTLSFLEVHEFP
jgi:hypothetical protein